MRGEEQWNQDLLDIIKQEIQIDFPDYKVSKTKVLKDIFLFKENGDPILQFGFVDQDIVIYKETLDVTGLDKVNSIFLHNVKPAERQRIIIPKLICELKYNGVTSHGLITYSQYASDIKSIFPECSYCLLMRFQKGASDNKLLRHGNNIDKIMFLEAGEAKAVYVSGDFQKELVQDQQLKLRFDEFALSLKNILQEKKSFFSK